MNKYDIYGQSKEKHFQLFSEHLTFSLFEWNDELDETHPAYSWEYIRMLICQYHFLMETCQSPIERILASKLLFMSDGYGFLRFAEFIGEGDDKSCYTYFTPQYQILNYRTDFLIRIYVDEKSFDIAIECDGHNFHEKTKEQVSKDKKRDRAFAKAGIALLRFSGSDIFSRTEECVDEITDFICSKKEEMMVAAGIISPRRKKV